MSSSLRANNSSSMNTTYISLWFKYSILLLLLYFSTLNSIHVFHSIFHWPISEDYRPFIVPGGIAFINLSFMMKDRPIQLVCWSILLTPPELWYGVQTFMIAKRSKFWHPTPIGQAIESFGYRLASLHFLDAQYNDPIILRLLLNFIS